MLKSLGLSFSLLTASFGVRAEDGPAPYPPVLVTVRDDVGFRPFLNDGLIWKEAAEKANKQSAVRTQQFARTVADPGFEKYAAQVFGCLAVTGSCAAPPAFLDEAAFDAAVTASATQQGFIVELVSEMTQEQMLIRAIATRVTLAHDVARTPIKARGGFIAVYTTRAPASVIDSHKQGPEPLEAFWAAGDPRRSSDAARRGVSELNALFAFLLKEGKEDTNVPHSWLPLTRVKKFPDKQRLACQQPPTWAEWVDASIAMGCSSFVLRDNGDSFVIVSDGFTAGWFDAAAAAWDADLPAYARLGIWK